MPINVGKLPRNLGNLCIERREFIKFLNIKKIILRIIKLENEKNNAYSSSLCLISILPFLKKSMKNNFYICQEMLANCQEILAMYV